jgi:hypothetical protein
VSGEWGTGLPVVNRCGWETGNGLRAEGGSGDSAMGGEACCAEGVRRPAAMTKGIGEGELRLSFVSCLPEEARFRVLS